jgi:hypothetical protein
VFAEFAVDEEFFGGEFFQHFVVTAAVGFSDEGAEFTLTALEVSVLEGVEGVFDLLGHGLRVGGGWVGLVLKGAGEEDVAVLVGCGVERVGRCWGVREGFE